MDLVAAETLRVNEPSAPLVVPADDPLATTEAPDIGDPSLESVTLPVTVLFCATATCNAKSIATGSRRALNKRFGFINSGFKIKDCKICNLYIIITF
jgi:hypothetical protein